MKLHHFYHVYADGDCETPMREHIRALKESGLYETLTTFKIGFVGKPHKIEEALVCLNSLGVVFDVAAREEYGWEQVTMIPMWEFSQQNDGLMLYCHTKGASDQSAVNIRWRRSMIYWNVIRWRDAVAELSTRSEAYGCHWIQPLLSMPEHVMGNWMFAGTFFWVRCNVLARFPKPALTHRHEAEGFVGYGWHEKPYSVYDPTPYFPNSAPFADQWIDHPHGVHSFPEFHEPKFYPA
jgi:hypothetical protein